MHEAQFYEKKENKLVRCNLCAHKCSIKPAARGICSVRENQNGILYTLSYGRIVSAAVDPIEKKPLYHFFPGSLTFSICTAGCNFGCLFCQNADISQLPKKDGYDGLSVIASQSFLPESIVELARERKCQSISYTYTEPTIFYEYARETAELAHSQGLKNIFVTNGYIAEEPLRQIRPYLDAANVDLKAFSDAFYKSNCKARLQPVLDTIKLMHELGIWIELTTLLITGQNDDESELTELAGWIVELDENIPWHVSAFQPNYKMQDIPPTSAKSVYKAIEIGQKAGLKYVYAGNTGGSKYQDTVCPACEKIAIKRQGYAAEALLQAGKCSACKTKMAGVFS